MGTELLLAQNIHLSYKVVIKRLKHKKFSKIDLKLLIW